VRGGGLDGDERCEGDSEDGEERGTASVHSQGACMNRSIASRGYCALW
jgi:hypothetical protein